MKGFEQIKIERRKLNVPANECLVAIKTTYNLLVDFLLEHGHVVYIVPPQATNAYQTRQRSSGAHTDWSDAALLASIMRTDRDNHHRLNPNTCAGYLARPRRFLVQTSAKSGIVCDPQSIEQKPHPMDEGGQRLCRGRQPEGLNLPYQSASSASIYVVIMSPAGVTGFVHARDIIQTGLENISRPVSSLVQALAQHFPQCHK